MRNYCNGHYDIQTGKGYVEEAFAFSGSVKRNKFIDAKIEVDVKIADIKSKIRKKFNKSRKDNEKQEEEETKEL